MIKKKIKKILIPLDGSKNSFRGLDEAIAIARQCQSIITAFYVIPIYPRNIADAIIPYQIHLSKYAKQQMNRAKTRAAQKGIMLRAKIVYGSPINEITDYAKNNRFDLIVIGSRGQSRIKEAFLGSVANGVVHKSKIPVLVVK